MKTRLLIFTFLYLGIFGIAQESLYEIQEVSIINYGDNRLLYRELDEHKTPLEGKHRIIDGYKSEYIIASFKNGMYHGVYQFFKDNVLRDSANYINGFKNGLCKKFSYQGKLISSGEFFNGKLNGLYTTYQNGKIITQQEFTMGVENGFFHRYDSESGEITQKTFYKNGKRDSVWVQHFISNICDYTEYSQFDEGVRVGEFSKVADNGVCLLKGYYSEGKKSGLWIYKTEDGVLSKEITYKEGIKEGPYKYYYEDGTLKEEGQYKDNEIISITQYKPNGRRIRRNKIK